MKGTQALVATALLFGAALAPAPAAADQPMIGDRAPGFRLAALGGGTVDLADFRGKIVVLHFGTGW